MTASLEAASKPTVHFAAVEFVDAEERNIAAEVWLDDLCRAAWTTKEVMKIGAFLSKLAAESSTAPLFLKDIESRYNIQQGEISMALNMMTTFRVVDGVTADRGQLLVRLRLGLIQSIRVREERAKLAALSVPSVVGALSQAATAMRLVDEQAA